MIRRPATPRPRTPRLSKTDLIPQLVTDSCARVEKLMRQIRRTRGAVEPRDIHDLRVATRRADAVLRLFDGWLPGRRARKLRRFLRRLRRDASQVRDLDVLQPFLAQLPSDLSNSTGPSLGQLLTKRRRQACRRMVRGARLGSRRRLRASAKNLARRVRWRRRGPEPTVAQLLAIRLASLDWLEDAPRRLKTQRDQDVHALRINFRRLRYQFELLAEAAARPAHDLTALLDLLRELQEHLGALHDRAMQERLLSQWIKQEKRHSVARQAYEGTLTKLRKRSTAGTRRQALRHVTQVRLSIHRLRRQLERKTRT